MEIPEAQPTATLAPSQPRLSLVIVNFKVPDLLKDCLRSLQPALAGIPSQVWVVDNASEDGSVEMVRECFPGVRTVANAENRGFAAANNQILRDVGGDYVMLLNPDTVVRPKAVERLIGVLDQRPRVGIAAPLLVSEDGRSQTSSWEFPSVLRTLQWMLGLRRFFSPRRRPESQAGGPVDWVSGACMLVRTTALREVGLLDEAFFMYGEDVDWCRRFKNRGWEVWLAPEARVVHLGGQSTAQFQNSGQTDLWTVQNGHNHCLYFNKHAGRTGAALVRWAYKLHCAGWWLRCRWRELAKGQQGRRSSSLYRQKLDAVPSRVREPRTGRPKGTQ